MEFMNRMIQWLIQDLLVTLLDESVFLNKSLEWMIRIEWKTNTFWSAPFHHLKKKDAHTGIDRWNWNFNFTTSIRFLTLSIQFWNWNWFSIPNPTHEGPAAHPLVPLFEESIFQNLAVSFRSSFLVHLCKTFQDRRWTKNELPKLTATWS